MHRYEQVAHGWSPRSRIIYSQNTAQILKYNVKILHITNTFSSMMKKYRIVTFDD